MKLKRMGSLCVALLFVVAVVGACGTSGTSTGGLSGSSISLKLVRDPGKTPLPQGCDVTVQISYYLQPFEPFETIRNAPDGSALKTLEGGLIPISQVYNIVDYYGKPYYAARVSAKCESQCLSSSQPILIQDGAQSNMVIDSGSC